ncbi:hypothetical protein ACFE04_028204 [Oxalis oulophora]
MDIEVEAGVKALSYKVKATSRESTPSQKAVHVIETDLRTYWSTATNTKEWILLELDEPCLLSHLRIYNKSVLEWEISAGLRFKPETFVKLRTRCEAPRRDMMYTMNYTPCRYVRISCLRGNPIAIFFIELIGVSVPSLEQEFLPLVNHLLPSITSHKQDSTDMHLQLLQDMTSRLLLFLPHLEADLSKFSDDPESNLRFFAMLAGPFYPLLHLVNERENAKSSSSFSDSEASKTSASQSVSALAISSNFEVASLFLPRKSRGTLPFSPSTSSSIAFRPDAIFVLLRKAYKDSKLGKICRMAAIILSKLIEPVCVLEESESPSSTILPTSDYSNLLGEEFQIPDCQWDLSILNVLDVGAVEEGILHILYACASQPDLCGKLTEDGSYFWHALPLVQALLPALRPCVSSPSEHVDDKFSQWRQPYVQQAAMQTLVSCLFYGVEVIHLDQHLTVLRRLKLICDQISYKVGDGFSSSLFMQMIVATSSSPSYRPLLRACAGYLSSYSPSHAKAATVLIDLCSSVLAPWIAQVIAKIDLTVELLEDLLGTMQGACYNTTRARAALKYIVLALSGHMDDIMGKYKEVKLKILFLLEMLEPFLDPAVNTVKSTIAFGDVSFTFLDRQEHTCAIALKIIRKAVQKAVVLPSLESEWRRGSVAPSVILCILEPHIQLPPEIDTCKAPVLKSPEHEPQLASCHVGASTKSISQDESDGKADAIDTVVKMDVYEDVSHFFAPPELRNIALGNDSGSLNENVHITKNGHVNKEQKHVVKQEFTKAFENHLVLEAGFSVEYFNLQADYLQLVNYPDCELRASEFRRFALDLHSQHEVTVEGHEAAVDALLLAAECYVNPYFVTTFSTILKDTNQMSINGIKVLKHADKNDPKLQTIVDLEKKRDKIVLQILLEAAELDRNHLEKSSDGGPYNTEGFDEQIIQLSSADIQCADAITLVRQNQALLCNFLIRQLQREQHPVHEILLHCLVFYLHSATKLYCAPEDVIDIILRSAEYLNGTLRSFYQQYKDGNLKLNPDKIHGVQRRWILLQKLIFASSGDAESDFAVKNLITPSAWMQKVSTFSCSASPLVRFLGWMAISHIARQYLKERFFLASDLSQLTHLLSVFSDELSLVDNIIDRKHENTIDQRSGDQSFQVIYPDLSKFIPNMKKEFEGFGGSILEAVALQLRSLSSSALPDILCWFSDLCSWPFFNRDQMARDGSNQLKGFHAKNARAIILYVLEAIVTEHMESMVPEMPRVLNVLASLSRASYCDVSFLESVLCLLKPLISYSLHKVSDDERLFTDDSCLSFESLCFDELLNDMKEKNDTSEKEVRCRALTLYVLASVCPDLSAQRRREVLKSLNLWSDFTAFEPSTSFHPFLWAFQKVMESCKTLLVNTLGEFNLLPLQFSHTSEVSKKILYENKSESSSWFLNDLCNVSPSSNVCENQAGDVTSNKKKNHLLAEEVEDFCKELESLITKLGPTIELCSNFHHQLTKNLTILSGECFILLRCLSSVAQNSQNAKDGGDNPSQHVVGDGFPVYWSYGLEGFAQIIVKLQETHCWQVASTILDCLLALPDCFSFDNVIGIVCSAIKTFSCNAPKHSWRLQTDKWLSKLFARGVQSLHESGGALSDMFCTMLGHHEPEQCLIALKHLGQSIRRDLDGGTETKSFSSIHEPFLSVLVSSAWDCVVVLASSISSLRLRTHAMALLIDFVPYASRHQLQSFLAAADSVLHGLGNIALSMCEGPLLQLLLALIAAACIYAPAEDISLIPEKVWKNIETLGSSRSDGRLGEQEQKACQVLCRLRNEGDEAKEVLKEVLSAKPSKELDPNFGSVRESILQVLTNLTSAQSYIDLFSRRADQDNIELEEAELEFDIVQRETQLVGPSIDSEEGNRVPCLADSMNDDNRLQQIKDRIQSIEKSKLREEIVARRQKKLFLRRERQKYLEEAASREAECLQELDRERAAEAEKEIERQRLLELERARTRELRHKLDLEKERQTQAWIFRARDRYRERDGGRSSIEANTRSSGGNLQSEITATPATVLMGGSHTFGGQPPTILQSRDRSDDYNSNYEENFDGSKDSGDRDSMGDPDLASAIDGQSSGLGSGHRQGSRGNSKSRQVMERRERENRREGKWERKQ